jgi:hypothetical protein
MSLYIAIILGVVEVALIAILVVMQNLKDEESWKEN